MVADLIQMRAIRGRESVTVRQRDTLREEVHALMAEAAEDALHMIDPARRLRESAIRDGRLADYQDATALLARIHRMQRRGNGGRAA